MSENMPDMVILRTKDIDARDLESRKSWPEYPQFEELRVIAYKPEIANYLESIEAAIYFQQLSHWQRYAKQPDGFFYKTAKEIEQETMISEKKQRACRQKLEGLGWIGVQKKMANGHPTYHFKVLVRSFGILIPTGDSPIGTGQNASSITKNTHKNNITSDLTEKKKDDINKIYKLWLIYMAVDPEIRLHGTTDSRRAALQEAMKRYKLTPKRSAAIDRRLDDAGYEMIIRAIKNIANSPFHMGQNDKGWKADLVDFLLRSYEKVEEWSNKTGKAEDMYS